MSFGSVGGAGAAVACQPIYPPRHLFVPDAQVTDQGDRQEERLVLAKRREQAKTARERRARQHGSMTISRQGDIRTDVGEGIEPSIVVRASEWWSWYGPRCSVVPGNLLPSPRGQPPGGSDASLQSPARRMQVPGECPVLDADRRDG